MVFFLRGGGISGNLRGAPIVKNIACFKGSVSSLLDFADFVSFSPKMTQDTKLGFRSQF